MMYLSIAIQSQSDQFQQHELHGLEFHAICIMFHSKEPGVSVPSLPY